MRRRLVAVLALVVTVVLLAAGCDGAATPDKPGKPGAPKQPKVATLSFGVFGTAQEVDAYRATVQAYNAEASTVDVELETWPTSDAMMADLDAGEQPPDVFLTARADLANVLARGLNEPLFDLLEARDISYGDVFSHDAIEAFSEEDALQCVPYSVSPMVMYINTDLVDFDVMRERGIDTPSPTLASWNFEEFRAAAQFATRKRTKSRGLSLDPNLASIAPYLYSGGGQLFDNDDEPLRLDLDSDNNRETLTTVLELARDPKVTLTDKQLSQAGPTEWFERGRLGMVEGFRSLTPELRAVPGLHFDVMPMPRINDTATVGDVTGLCISSAGQLQRAADLMVHLISDEGFAPVARAGYVVPANLSAARSEDFLQPDQQPAHAGTFNASVDRMVLQPLLDDYEELSAVVDPLLRQLLQVPVINDLGEQTAAIDETSRSVLDPDYVPPTEVAPSDGSSGEPSSGDPSVDPSATSTP